MPYVFSCPTCLIPYVLLYLICLVLCLLSCLTCLVCSRSSRPWCSSFTCPMPYVLSFLFLIYVISSLTCIELFVFLRLTCLCPKCSRALHVPRALCLASFMSITTFLLLFPHTSHDFFLFISNSLVFLGKYLQLRCKHAGSIMEWQSVLTSNMMCLN